MEESLKKIRKEHHLTQAELATIINMPLRTYQNYETDEKRKGSFTYQRMMEILDEYFRVDEEHGLVSVDEIKEVCNEVFSQYDVNYCYLFGSYARGEARENSDIDLFISTSLTGLDLVELIDKLHTALNKNIELIKSSEIEEFGQLVDDVLREGIRIYSR